VALAQPFHTIRSPSHLFRVLVTEHQFERAELLYRSNLRDQLSAETLVLPLLELGANVQPQDYISLISEVAFPNLVINDELLVRLKFWCCEVADALDDKNNEHLNLDAAILLLQVRTAERSFICRATSCAISHTLSDNLSAFSVRRRPWTRERESFN